MGALLHLFPILTLSLYLCASAMYLFGLFSDSRLVSNRLASRVLSAGFFFNLLSAYSQFVISSDSTETQYDPSLANTLFAISLILVGLFLLLQSRLSIQKLGAFVTPLAVLFLTSSGVLFHFETDSSTFVPKGPLLWLHIATTVFGHVAFVFAFGVSIALILQESLMKRKLLFKLQRKLPAILVLDRLNTRFLSLGFLLMLLGVLSGIWFALSQGLGLFVFDNRLLWSVLTLGIYAALLMGHAFAGLRGRRAAWFSVAGFCTVLASFFSVIVLGDGFHVH